MIHSFNTTEEVQGHPTRMAILPVGATEQHSRHLPLNTDTLIIEAVAVGVARELNAYALPALPYSISHMHRGSRGTVWLRNTTLMQVIRDIAVSLRHEKFKQLVLLNGHGGNFILTPIIQDLNMEFPDFLTLAVHPSECILSSGIFGSFGMMHADEFETSCVLYLKKEAVRWNKIRDQTQDPDRELLRYLPFRKFSKLTHSGHPSRATAEKGRQAMDHMVKYSARQIRATLKKVKASTRK